MVVNITIAQLSFSVEKLLPLCFFAISLPRQFHNFLLVVLLFVLQLPYKA